MLAAITMAILNAFLFFRTDNEQFEMLTGISATIWAATATLILELHK